MSGGEFHVIGNVCITEHGTGRTWRASNAVTSGGAAMIRDWLLALPAGVAPRPPTYFSFASGVVADGGRFLTRIDSEHFRTAVCQRDISGSAVALHAYLEPTDANGVAASGTGILPGTTLQSVALWGGEATDEIASGILFAVANLDPPIHKTPTKSYSADWIITPSGKLT